MKISSKNLIMQANNEVSPLCNKYRLSMKHNNDRTPNPNYDFASYFRWTEAEMTTSGCKNTQYTPLRNKVIYTLKCEKKIWIFNGIWRTIIWLENSKHTTNIYSGKRQIVQNQAFNLN